MGYVIKITHEKAAGLAENIEKGLRHIGKAMQCIDELMEGDDYGYGERDDDWDDDDRFGDRGYNGRGMSRGYGERRGGGRRRDGRGRYI